MAWNYADIEAGVLASVPERPEIKYMVIGKEIHGHIVVELNSAGTVVDGSDYEIVDFLNDAGAVRCGRW